MILSCTLLCVVFYMLLLVSFIHVNKVFHTKFSVLIHGFFLNCLYFIFLLFVYRSLRDRSCNTDQANISSALFMQVGQNRWFSTYPKCSLSSCSSVFPVAARRSDCLTQRRHSSERTPSHQEPSPSICGTSQMSYKSSRYLIRKRYVRKTQKSS